MSAPPAELVRALVAGPSLVTAVEWHERIDSTMRRTADLAVEGAGEGLLVGADVQTAGRGRLGRTWTAPAGSSLLVSVLLRPALPREHLPLLPLLAGLALAEAVAPHVPASAVALKWPNDLVVDGSKAAGVLVEAVDGGGVAGRLAAVVGVGLNVDWRGVDLPEGAAATSLAQAAGAAVDRWRVLAGLAGVLGKRYAAWQQAPAAFLDDYRARCTTLGRQVRVTLPAGDVLTGRATAVTDRGALRVRQATGAEREVHAGDVVHVRPA